MKSSLKQIFNEPPEKIFEFVKKADELKLKKKIAIEKEDIPKVNKKDIMAWLESFRNGKVEDKKYQTKIIDAFLISAYLYDDEIDLVFNFTGSKIKIRSKFNKDHIAKVKASIGDSFKTISGIPEGAQANHAALYVEDGTFVLSYKLRD